MQSVGHRQIPEWKRALIERKRQAREEEKQLGFNGWRPGFPQTSSTQGGKMMYRVTSPPPRSESHDITRLPALNLQNGSSQGYQNGDVINHTPPFSPVNNPKVRTVHSTKHRKSSISSVSSGGDLNSSFDPESAQTEINQDYLNSTRWSMPSEPDEPVPLEKYRPGFVNILRSKWANLLGDTVSENSKPNGGLKKASSMENLLDSPSSPSHSSKSSTSKPVSQSVQSTSGERFAKSAVKSQSMEALLDKPVKRGPVKSSSSSSARSGDYLVRNDNCSPVPITNSTEHAPKNESELRANLTISIPPVSQSGLSNGHTPEDGLLSPAEPERLDPDEELPRPNTVLTALSLFEKGDSKKAKHPLSPRSPTSPRSPHSHTTNYLINGQSKPAAPVVVSHAAASPPKKDYVAPNRFMQPKKKKVPTATLR